MNMRKTGVVFRTCIVRLFLIKKKVKMFFSYSGNDWKNRKNFVKQAGKFYPLEIDYGQVMLLF